MIQYSNEALSLLADLRELADKHAARVSDETEAERTERTNQQHQLQTALLAVIKQEAWDAAGALLLARKPALVTLRPEVKFLARGPLSTYEELPEEGLTAEPGDYIVQVEIPECAFPSRRLVFCEQEFLDWFGP